MQFIGYDSIQISFIHILLLSNLYNNIASIQKNRGNKSHCVVVALDHNKGILASLNPILGGKYQRTINRSRVERQIYDVISPTIEHSVLLIVLSQ